MSKVTPVEEPKLSVKENTHLHQDVSLGEFLGEYIRAQLDKTLNQDVTIDEKSIEESIPESSEYLEPDVRKEPSGIIRRKGGHIEL